MWTALFQAITATVQFVGTIVGRKKAATAATVDAAAARAGTLAGAAADLASKKAGKK